MNELSIIYASNAPIKTKTLLLEEVVRLANGLCRTISTEHEVLWLRESESTLKMYHRGAKIDYNTGTWTDGYGTFGSSINYAIERAEHVCQYYKIKKSDALEIRVHTVVNDVPVFKMTDEDYDIDFARQKYYKLDGKYKYNGKPLLRTLILDTVVWSSKTRKPISLEDFCRAPNESIL